MKEVVRRVRTDPMTHAVALYTLGGGVRLVLTAATLGVLHPYVIAGVGLIAALGALLTVVGLQWRDHDSLTGRVIERVGLMFMASTWLIHGYIMLTLVGAPITAFMSLVLAGGLCLRARNVHKRIREFSLTIKEAVRVARSERDTNSNGGE